jgi:hypothetical protein
MAVEIEDAIETNATGPKRASVDGVTVEQHDLEDQIEADRYLKGKAASVVGLGVRRVLVSPPGPI